jgi:hypothetical protein
MPIIYNPSSGAVDTSQFAPSNYTIKQISTGPYTLLPEDNNTLASQAQ